MKTLSVHVLMHVPYENPGCILDWLAEQNAQVSYTKFYESIALPSVADIDWLIVMGGPMSVYEENQYSWLAEEKQFIKCCVDNNKVVLGICLGSQLLAEVLGARVYPNKVKEIGWFDIFKTEKLNNSNLFCSSRDQFVVFHWHGDTYDLPDQCMPLFYSDHCQHQGFVLGNRVVALQFHLEVTKQTLSGMVENGLSELIPSSTVQSADDILALDEYIAQNNQIMFSLLNALNG